MGSSGQFCIYFYPRPPRGGRRATIMLQKLLKVFLSTPSARRATEVLIMYQTASGISIHALREEGDLRLLMADFATLEFLSTPSARRATYLRRRCAGAAAISIHALREEGDQPIMTISFSNVRFLSTPSARRATPAMSMLLLHCSHFYPRPPRGGRPKSCTDYTAWGIFLSTPSARRATYNPPAAARNWIFLSTPSARRATRLLHLPAMGQHISIHALREEGDQ